MKKTNFTDNNTSITQETDNTPAINRAIENLKLTEKLKSSVATISRVKKDLLYIDIKACNSSHYTGPENIRFSIVFFEKTFCRPFIDHIDIHFSAKINANNDFDVSHISWICHEYEDEYLTKNNNERRELLNNSIKLIRNFIKDNFNSELIINSNTDLYYGHLPISELTY
ncbi:hypothetical protein [Endozoicomonas sp. GU-1]|uniref:hypothetical protein n=1 Tax=Endozoicomonas sp. GU-1 TaxID=3009078 RepID=UPI0022B4C35E|nr:hypothetical protein [Endozoicomonas sp. GU-1]WBA79833.1 hypothetical protein O2T12_15845 [Endozoicomonas sp. GU-1]WBA87408.1 hypothetical protein O3276_05085 [Endozoicomonas sp. GU-1]